MTDPVNHPTHYEQGPFECIELTQYFDFCIGNAIKYVWRHQFKGKPVEDLKKAQWYIQREIQRTGSDRTLAPTWRKQWWMLNQLERLDWAQAKRFWFALHEGNLQWTLDALNQMIEREQAAQAEW